MAAKDPTILKWAMVERAFSVVPELVKIDRGIDTRGMNRG